jgi:hypothetical protein
MVFSQLVGRKGKVIALHFIREKNNNKNCSSQPGAGVACL